MAVGASRSSATIRRPTGSWFSRRMTRPAHGRSPLPNPDASVAAVRLSDGTVLVACNLSRQGRSTLDLVLFDAAADTWHRLATLDDEPGERFAYPYMVQDGRGRVHLVYAWKMRRIRHVVMNEAWLLAQPRRAVT